ncbi:rta1 domain-containing [Fusarium albosuccineum]|uniref:Rta1 domain-containing n=1 Tax=Fusarium albosuccineum TaxID=1237068 RepID=A0A8H4PCE7_9HYPO|nr:rta1 domain-containing [Fusarium albosuccineum]
MSSAQNPGEFVFYHYDPFLPAACIFIARFSLTSAVHLYQLARLQTCLTLLLGPALLAASVYMVLGRLIQFLDAGTLSPIRPRWLTKVFVLGDVLSFVTQGAGGAIHARAKSLDDLNLGEDVIVAGLVIQIVFFAVFIIVIGIFHYRINGSPTTTSSTTNVPWRRFLQVLYVASCLIMIRSVFRVAEYAMGSDGPLLSSEAYLYVFDAALVFLVAAMFNIFDPGKIIPRQDDPVALLYKQS